MSYTQTVKWISIMISHIVFFFSVISLDVRLWWFYSDMDLSNTDTEEEDLCFH